MESVQEWIVARYGPISMLETELCVFLAVPVLGGVAMGAGGTLDLALEDLKKDLSGGKTRGFRKQLKRKAECP